MSNEQFDWEASDPEDRQMSSEALEVMRAGLAERGTKALLVAQDDHIVCEWYAEGHGPNSKHYTASMAKAIVGGLSLMLAMDDGLISPEDHACKFVPSWADDVLKSRIKIAHLATHTSGIEDAELSKEERDSILAGGKSLNDHHMELPGWKGDFWRRQPDPFTIARDSAPVIFEPGSEFAYSNTGIAMLAWVVTAAIRNGPHKDIRTLLAERLFKAIGIADEDWSVGYGQTYEVDGLSLVASWGGGNFTARAVARIGRLMMHRGDWDGRQLISAEIVDRAVCPATKHGSGYGHVSGLSWWTHRPRAYSAIPRNSFYAAGAAAQILLVIPHLETIVVRNGSLIGRDIWDGMGKHLVEPLMAAYLPPHPRSETICGIDWAPAESIRRDAWDSDTWPVTWGDDDNIYCTWADGVGFETNQAPEKMSLGFARISGGPDDFVGENIRSGTGEDLGNGAVGKKGSGLLMVKGVLYMWARNANRKGEQSQLAWSDDHAETWTWADWTFKELGYCTFLNFGRDYSGARDEYVYVYSPDHPSAYVGADRMLLLRVPAYCIREKQAYHFLSGMNESGLPLWSSDRGDAVAVFEHAGRCSRNSVHYNAPLGRYILWQQLTNAPEASETRFGGGFAMYEAPEPWGPWRTVYYTEHWDTGPGETAVVPTKWIGPDGTEFALVFSGNDYFSVRKGHFVLGG